MVASEYQTVFFKFDSSFNIVNSPDGLAGKRIFKGTTGKLNLLGAYINPYEATGFPPALYVMMGGFWLASGSKDAAVILKGSTDLDFSAYTCGIVVDDLRAWDTDWNPTLTVTGAPGLGTVSVTTLAVTKGSNLLNWPWPLVHEAYSVSLRTISFF